MGVKGLQGLALGIQNDPLCDLNISRTLKWAKMCESHRACDGSIFERTACARRTPRRLLAVGSYGDSTVKLILVDDMVKPLNYAALSYCWGKTQTGIITTDQNLDQMFLGISMSLLSCTVQDAVKVTRRLQIPYLWVDALCIIQKQQDNSDWKTESKRMQVIYANAYLTIAATSAAEASDGFLNHVDRSGIPVPFKADKLSTPTGIIFFREYISIERSFRQDVEESPLLNRAWVKQERLLSRRTVDFTSRQIYWTCRLRRHAEDGQRDDDGSTEASAFLHCLQAIRGLQGVGVQHRTMLEQQFSRAWGDLIQEYTTLRLTYESDRLPAISGIASVGSHVLGACFLSGLWYSMLADELLWNATDCPAKRSGAAGIPSWSWASILGTIRTGGYDPASSEVELRGSSAHTTRGQSLYLRGRIHRCIVDANRHPTPTPCRSDRKLKDPQPVVPTYGLSLRAAVGPRPLGSYFTNECVFDGTRGVEVEFYAIGLRSPKYGSVTRHIGLLLRRLEDSDGHACFERVGRVWSSDPFWYSLDSSTLSLI